MVLYSIKTELPTSCRQGVLTLLPKNGVNELLKNWQPITLLSCDLICFTKCLSLRLKCVLHDIIHADETCGIPGRQVYDSIVLSRDMNEFAKCDGIPMSIIYQYITRKDF